MLAVTGDRRSNKFPDLPTVVESGISGYILKSWISVFGPAGMPEPLLKQVNHSIIEVLKDSAIQQKLARIGFQPMLLDQQEFQKFFLAERAFWKEIVDKAGIKIGE
jgi:tripartite-type tricarboxylate transporter receptor subunit TctC